jgi:hypothetical protein
MPPQSKEHVMSYPNEKHRQLRGHRFYPTAAECDSIPTLSATEEVAMADKVVHLHYFVGGCDWWVVELDEESALAFGYACLGPAIDAEWGYFSLVELEDIVAEHVASVPMYVERDLHWRPRPASECQLPGHRAP